MEQIKIIAVDTGNRLIKTAHAPAFSAGLVSHGDTPPLVATDTLIYEGKYYSFSESQGYHRRDKTADEYYFILTLAAIAREIVIKNSALSSDCDEAVFRRIMQRGGREKWKYNESIVLSVGLPPRDMKIQSGKFKEYFLQKGKTLTYTYNGMEFTVTIEEVLVSPQGFAAIFPNDVFLQVSQSIQSYIIDIGGYTTDIALVVNKKIDTNFFESLDFGVIHMMNEISSQVEKECQKSISGPIIEAILKGQRVGDEQVEDIVINASRAYAKEIIDALKDHGIDLALSVPVLCGGGALLMKEALMKEIGRDKTIILGDIRANAIGYEVLAKRIMREREREH